mgnify:CR=1 FL=1
MMLKNYWKIRWIVKVKYTENYQKITEKLLTNNVKCSIIIKQKRRSNPLLTLSYRKRLINIVILVFIYKIYIRTLFRRWVGL